VRLTKRWIGSTPTSVGFTRMVVGPRSHQKMLGADKGYDNRDVVADLRISGITPHGAQKIQARCSLPIDDCTARHHSYSKSINTKKRIEQMFGWIKQAEFRDWFHSFDATDWDQQMEDDMTAGNLEWLANEAISDSKAGRCSEL
jgi:hypothetical protein